MGGGHPCRAELPHLQKRGYQALQIMEQHLSTVAFFVKDRCSIADVARHQRQPRCLQTLAELKTSPPFAFAGTLQSQNTNLWWVQVRYLKKRSMYLLVCILIFRVLERKFNQ